MSAPHKAYGPHVLGLAGSTLAGLGASPLSGELLRYYFSSSL